MAKQTKTLQLMALKLCLNEEEKVLSKAAEFERLLQMKSTTNNLTDTAKVVICLDLAATLFRVDFDQISNIIQEDKSTAVGSEPSFSALSTSCTTSMATFTTACLAAATAPAPAAFPFPWIGAGGRMEAGSCGAAGIAGSFGCCWHKKKA